MQPWCSGFFATFMADWLSTLNLDGKLGLYPNSLRMLCIHIISFPASTAAMYSASVVDKATIGCNLLLQLTAPVPTLIKYPLVDLPDCLHPPKSASENDVNSSPEDEGP